MSETSSAENCANPGNIKDSFIACKKATDDARRTDKPVVGDQIIPYKLDEWIAECEIFKPIIEKVYTISRTRLGQPDLREKVDFVEYNAYKVNEYVKKFKSGKGKCAIKNVLPPNTKFWVGFFPFEPTGVDYTLRGMETADFVKLMTVDENGFTHKISKFDGSHKTDSGAEGFYYKLMPEEIQRFCTFKTPPDSEYPVHPEDYMDSKDIFTTPEGQKALIKYIADVKLFESKLLSLYKAALVNQIALLTGGKVVWPISTN